MIDHEQMIRNYRKKLFASYATGATLQLSNAIASAKELLQLAEDGAGEWAAERILTKDAIRELEAAKEIFQTLAVEKE